MNVSHFELGVACGQINDAFNEPDDLHDWRTEPKRENRNQKHNQTFFVVAKDELMNSQRTQ